MNRPIMAALTCPPPGRYGELRFELRLGRPTPVLTASADGQITPRVERVEKKRLDAQAALAYIARPKREGKK